MTYTIREHGDILEQQAANLIRDRFPYYELVWQTYIGNQGNNSIAELPNYSDELKRKHFAENSYTVLESVYIVDHILNDNAFKQQVDTFEDYIEFNKAFVTVFAFFGRIHDTVIKASDSLKYDNSNFKDNIHKFYEARSIVLHGKKVPLIFDDIGFAMIPFLKTSFIKGNAWDDKRSTWKEANKMDKDYVVDKLTNFFDDFLQLINSEYAVFYNHIIEELKSIPTRIKFHFKIENISYIPNVSGVTTFENSVIDVYSFYKRNITLE